MLLPRAWPGCHQLCLLQENPSSDVLQLHSPFPQVFSQVHLLGEEGCCDNQLLILDLHAALLGKHHFRSIHFLCLSFPQEDVSFISQEYFYFFFF